MKLMNRIRLILIFLFSSMAVHAAGLQVGPGVYFESSPVVEGFDLCIWGLRFDTRFNTLDGWISVEAPLALGFDEDLVELSVAPGALFSIPVGRQMRIDAGMGTRMKVSLYTDGSWTVNNEDYRNTGEALKLMKPDYRIGMMFDLESFAVRFATRIPTKGTLVDLDLSPEWDEAEVNMSILVGVA